MFQSFITRIQLAYRLMRDERVPISAKLIPAFALLYVLSPIDLIPDFIMVIGLVDDVAIVMGSLRMLEMFTPDYIVAEHRAALGLPYEA